MRPSSCNSVCDGLVNWPTGIFLRCNLRNVSSRRSSIAYVEGLRAVMLIRHSADVVDIVSLFASIKKSSRRASIVGRDPSAIYVRRNLQIVIMTYE